MRLSALRLHWVSAVYLCLLRPLLGWRSADQRERGVNKAKPLTELWAPAVEPTVPSSRDGDLGLFTASNSSRAGVCPYLCTSARIQPRLENLKPHV